jgi:hypothetical protein
LRWVMALDRGQPEQGRAMRDTARDDAPAHI